MRAFSFLLASLFALALHADSQVLVPDTVAIPAGTFITGSDREEREAAYVLDEIAYGHSITREQAWYERERPRGEAGTEAFAITRTPITNAQYAGFVAETGHPWPQVDRATWTGYGLIHPYSRTHRHAWNGPAPPAGRETHPVVLVSYDDATAYADWLSARTGKNWRLPDESQWEKAVRGSKGWRFPWGDRFEPAHLNSHDLGPFDTVPVGGHDTGRSPFGILDGAGQVFEWIRKPVNAQRAWVKGGSWDDKGCGVCRPAARHARPTQIRHILIGFRLVTVPLQD